MSDYDNEIFDSSQEEERFPTPYGRALQALEMAYKELRLLDQEGVIVEQRTLDVVGQTLKDLNEDG